MRVRGPWRSRGGAGGPGGGPECPTLWGRWVCRGQECQVWYGMVWYGMVWYGMVWYGMVWCGMVWYGMLLLSL